MAADIVLLGSGRFAQEVFRKAIDKGLLPQAIFTYPPKEKGRGHRLYPDPVHELASERGIPLYLYDDYRAGSDACLKLKQLSPDLGIVLSFRILPSDFFSIPKMGMINLHPSLLPDLRGAAPLNWAIARGYTRSGISTFILNEEVDSGKILGQKEFAIKPDENVLDLTKKIVEPSAELLIESIPFALDASFLPKMQSPKEITRAPKITKEHLKIDWNKDNRSLHNQIRAFYPSAFALYNGRQVAIEVATTGDEKGKPGEIIGVSEDSIVIGCGTGTIHVDKLKPQGKKQMSGRAFYNGYAKDDLYFT